MRVHSFSWHGDIPLQLLLPLLARHVHHRAPEAELHRSDPRGQDSAAGGRMPLPGSGRARRGARPTGRFPGICHPLTFSFRSCPMITSESETPTEKVGVAQYGNVQWLHKGEMAPTLFSLVFRPGLM